MIFFLTLYFWIPALNQVTLLGRVGADPQKRGSTDHPVVTFSLATHTNYKYESGKSSVRLLIQMHQNYQMRMKHGSDPNHIDTLQTHVPELFIVRTLYLQFVSFTGEYMQRTDWHRVCIFKPVLRDTIYNYLKKGNRVLINGRLSYGEIKDDDGNPRPTTSIIADDVIFFQSNSA